MESKENTIGIAFVIAAPLLCFWLLILSYLPESQMMRAAAAIIHVAYLASVVVGIAVSLGAVAGLGLVVWILYNRGLIWRSSARIRSAEATKAEREAHLQITVAPPGSQVFVSEVAGLNLSHRPIHLLPGKINGAPVTYAPEDWRSWFAFNFAHSTSRKPELATEEMPQLQAPLPEHIFLEHYLMSGQSTLRNLFLGVGRFPDGQVRPVSAPLSELVNIAVGGSSGFGKSVCMQSLAYQVINAKENPRPVLLDTQGVTFTQWAGDERLLWPLVSKPQDILMILIALFRELERRQELFSHWRGVDKLEKYNAVVSVEERLPMIPIFFDEFGLVADHKEIARYAERLSQAGRKVGMPMISAAQTWYSNDISSALRANLSTSIQFYARSKSQSRVLIEDSAAVDLLRKGQAYARLPGQPGLIEIQTPDISSLVDATPTLIEAEVALPVDRPVDRPGDDTAERVLELYDNGASVSAIAAEVFGSKGGPQNEKVRVILEQYGRV